MFRKSLNMFCAFIVCNAFPCRVFLIVFPRLKVRVFLLVVFLVFPGLIDEHLPSASPVPAHRHPIGAVFLLLHFRLAVACYVQCGVVMATVLHKVQFFASRLRIHREAEETKPKTNSKSIRTRNVIQRTLRLVIRIRVAY